MPSPSRRLAAVIASVLPAVIALSFASGTAVSAAPYDDATRDAPPAKDGSIGTAHPIGGYAAADDGRWLILCQARADTDHDGKIDVTYDIHFTSGDQLVPYLILGSGVGMEIDYLAARSARGEWLAVVRRGELELIEAATYRRWVLHDVDMTLDGMWTREHNVRFASIAANGSRMTYLRKHRGADIIVIRDLPSGTEREVAIRGKLWRVSVDPSGRWAKVSVMRADTDGDGKIEWPGGPSGYALGGCGSDIIHHMNPTDGDRPTVLWLDLASGQLVDDPAVVGVVGDDLLRRQADGALVLGRSVISEASCHAEIRSVIAAPPRVIVTCGSARELSARRWIDAPVVVVGPGFHKSTRRIDFRGDGDRVQPNRRFELIDDKSTTHDTYVDLVTGEEIIVPGTYVYNHEALVVSHVAETWAVFDLSKRVNTPLHATGAFHDFSGPLVEIGVSRYDLRTGRRVGAVTDEVVFVDERGRILFGPNVKTPAGHFSPGPFHWATP